MKEPIHYLKDIINFAASQCLTEPGKALDLLSNAFNLLYPDSIKPEEVSEILRPMINIIRNTTDNFKTLGSSDTKAPLKSLYNNLTSLAWKANIFSHDSELAKFMGSYTVLISRASIEEATATSAPSDKGEASASTYTFVAKEETSFAIPTKDPSLVGGKITIQKGSSINLSKQDMDLLKPAAATSATTGKITATKACSLLIGGKVVHLKEGESLDTSILSTSASHIAKSASSSTKTYASSKEALDSLSNLFSKTNITELNFADVKAILESVAPVMPMLREDLSKLEGAYPSPSLLISCGTHHQLFRKLKSLSDKYGFKDFSATIEAHLGSILSILKTPSHMPIDSANGGSGAAASYEEKDAPSSSLSSTMPKITIAKGCSFAIKGQTIHATEDLTINGEAAASLFSSCALSDSTSELACMTGEALDIQ